jgi:hypothetical protein
LVEPVSQTSWRSQARPFVAAVLKELIAGRRAATYGEVYAIAASKYGLKGGGHRHIGAVAGWINDDIARIEKSGHYPYPSVLIVGQNSNEPGTGFDWYQDDWQRRSSDRHRLSYPDVIDRMQTEAWDYPGWAGLWERLERSWGHVIPKNSRSEVLSTPGVYGRGGGESPEHLRLKELIYQNPSLVGAAAGLIYKKREFPFVSGDMADLAFIGKTQTVIVEVKPSGCGPVELVRGLFQLTKYKSLMIAHRTVSIAPTRPGPVRTILATSEAVSEFVRATARNLRHEVVTLAN